MSPTTAPYAPPAPERSPDRSLSERVQSLRLPAKADDPRPFAIVPWTLAFVFGLATLGLGAMLFRTKSPSEAELLKKVEELTNAGVLPQSVSTGPGAAPKNGTAPKSGAAPKPAAAPGSVVLESKGYVIPVHQIQVSPKVGGMVMDLFIEEGMQVKEGDVLAKLETVEYQADYDRVASLARAAKHRHDELTKYRDLEIRQAKADLEDTQAQLRSAEKEYRRNVELVATRAVSPKDVDQAESAFRSFEARERRLQLTLEMWQKGPRDEKIGAALAEYDQFVAERDKAKWRLDNTTVRAPASGTILTKKAEKGNQINPSAFSNGLSASLCDMADLSDMEVDLAIAERDVHRVFKGQKCKVVSEAFPDRPYEGLVSRVMPQADRAKGAVPVRVQIRIPRDEEGKYLRPEMGAIVTFFAAEATATASTPNAPAPGSSLPRLERKD